MWYIPLCLVAELHMSTFFPISCSNVGLFSREHRCSLQTKWNIYCNKANDWWKLNEVIDFSELISLLLRLQWVPKRRLFHFFFTSHLPCFTLSTVESRDAPCSCWTLTLDLTRSKRIARNFAKECQKLKSKKPCISARDAHNSNT